VKCRFCGKFLDDDLAELANQRRQTVQPTEFLVPTGVSAWSIISCYAGFIGFCLPFVGVLFAIPAFICGIVALRKRRGAGSYGAVTSDIRAIIGLILSSLAILGWGGLLVVLLLEKGK